MRDKKEQMKNITRKQRLAMIGLSIVLLSLILFSTIATLIVRQAMNQASQAATMNDLYQGAYNQILLEDLRLHEYTYQPSSTQKDIFLAAYQQALAALRKIESVGDADDIAGVQPILAEQSHLLTATKHLFTLVNAHDFSQAVVFHTTTIDPIINTISEQINTSADLEHNIMLQSLMQMGSVLHIVFTVISLVFASGIISIFFFQGILRRTQRQKYVMELAEQDMLRMADAQLHLLPQEFPAVSGLETYAHCRPARDVGGDFYTFSKHTSGQYVLTIGDVSGKGLRAALLMAMVRTIVHVTVHALLQLGPEAITSKVNEYLYDDFTKVGMFATIFVGCYDPVTQCLTYTNAGHSPVIYCPAGGSACFLAADAPMIGVLPILPTKASNISLGPGDVLVMATDGLSEAQNTGGEMFGYKRLLTLVESLQQESAQHIAETLFEAVNHFATGCEQFDDQTLVIVKGTTQ